MNVTQSRYRLTIGAVLLAGTALLAGCATPPATTTTSSQQTTTTETPQPSTVTTTTTSTDNATDDATEEAAPITHVHHKHPRYVMRHRPARESSGEMTTTTEQTETPAVITSTTVKKTDTMTR